MKTYWMTLPPNCAKEVACPFGVDTVSFVPNPATGKPLIYLPNNQVEAVMLVADQKIFRNATPEPYNIIWDRQTVIDSHLKFSTENNRNSTAPKVGFSLYHNGQSISGIKPIKSRLTGGNTEWRVTFEVTETAKKLLKGGGLSVSVEGGYQRQTRDERDAALADKLINLMKQ